MVHLSRRVVLRLATMAMAVLASLILLPAAANAWSYGFNRVQTAAEDSAAATGYGPGWVGLSYKTNGPIVGYLFARDFRFGDGTVKTAFDHMDIRGTKDYAGGHPTITRWPWGYAHGSFGGCAYGYGTSKFAIVRSSFSSASCAGGPNAGPDGSWWHNETIFCTANSTDYLCSPVGVWAENKPPGNPGPKPATSRGCYAYGNIGATGAYSSGTPAPTHLLGYVPAGHSLNLRYVARNRQWVMAMWNSGTFVGGIRWGFFPRSCVF
ncbi:MAG TPA: hypothetical protein VFC19_38745 [Candidatus Limnocylindrales bacterium]|nr:hypothetical protein [Candidatus Limnocylindrales bacterium]